MWIIACDDGKEIKGVEMFRIMISGITSSADAMWILNEKVTDVGLALFNEKNKDYVKMENAYGILRVLQAAGKEKAPRTVAITDSPSAEQIAMIQKFGFDYMQVQGKLEKSIYDRIQIPIIRMVNPEHISALDSYLENEKVAAILLDISGWIRDKHIDWKIPEGYISRIKSSGKKCILSGNYAKISEKKAVENLNPDGVDVNVAEVVDKESIHTFLNALPM